MANAGKEIVEKLKRFVNVAKNLGTTTKNKAFELVDDTKSEVKNAVNKTTNAAGLIQTSGNQLVSGVKNFFGAFGNTGKPSENLVRAVPEAGLPKGSPNMMTGKIQETEQVGARRTRRRRHRKSRQWRQSRRLRMQFRRRK